MAKKKITKRRKTLVLAVLLVFLLITFESFLIMLRYSRLNKSQPKQVGISFSQVQAERFDGNWHENYIALLDDLKFRHIRIPAYWDRIEKKQGEFDFSEIDWMIDEASKRNAKITLVIGQKNIRYPECYYPAWVDTQNTSATATQAVNMVQEVASHYKDNQAIEAWQLENEFLLKSFGKCPINILTNEQLKREFIALKSIDSTRPIIFTQSDQFGFPVRGPFADIFGFSMYRWSWRKDWGYWRYPQGGEYFWWKAALISLVYNQQIKIHELQAEAWGPIGNEHLSYDETLKSMSPKQFRENIQYANETRIQSYDLWGAEWWWHMKQQGHPEMWEEVKTFMAEVR